MSLMNRAASAPWVRAASARLPYTIAAAKGAKMMFQSLRAASSMLAREKQAI